MCRRDLRAAARRHVLGEAAGSGWVLVGDAGHFKDPSPRQGIADALRQAEQLAEAVSAGLQHGRLDRRLLLWARWRDRDALGRHARAHAFGAAGPPPHVLVQAQRDILSGPDPSGRFWGPSISRLTPRQAVGPVAVARAATRSVAAGRLTPAEASGELAGLMRRSLFYGRARRRTTATPPAVPMRGPGGAPS